MFKAAVDVFYKADSAKAVCLLFENWQDNVVADILTALVNDVAAYEPGAFYKRELPCILSVLQQVDLSTIDVIIIDGYVYLGDEQRKGLGAYLYEALQQKVAVIGVAKTSFYQSRRSVAKVYRGKSRNPLFITSAGIDVLEAAHCIRSMAGEFRMPFLLQVLDRKTRKV